MTRPDDDDTLPGADQLDALTLLGRPYSPKIAETLRNQGWPRDEISIWFGCDDDD